ncbi:hypothetical protein C3747_248g24c [Trypanosoma cruzi]|uniref:Uncharacterized protein n=1 Tax=Trypanosoma cruzi TaxID=5693 RepID=A0A2V2VKZ5_TRYCR|nr:hypothetical protein TcYC6_0032880 [Trypanosoma cruzi]PWU97109.1 hypothetical protein C3747_248g24c [Trypanosoma cruzi]
MLAAGTFIFFCGVSVSLVLIVASWSQRWHLHASVSVALFPVAAVIALGFSVSAQKIVEYIHETAKLNVVPPFLSQMALRIRPIAGDAITFFDIQIVAILLFVCYASVVLQRHLVDISRLLKISRRRIFMK